MGTEKQLTGKKTDITDMSDCKLTTLYLLAQHPYHHP